MVDVPVISSGAWGHLPAAAPLQPPGGAAEPAPCSGARGWRWVWSPGLAGTLPSPPGPAAAACLPSAHTAGTWDLGLPALLASLPG